VTKPMTGQQIAAEVNRRIRAMGRSEKLVAGRGYCYFCEGDASAWYTCSVYVPRISDCTPDEWMVEFNGMLATAARGW
jgi:hypothetical protein